MRRPPEPVTRTPRTASAGTTAKSSSSSAAVASLGLPLMRRYRVASTG